MKVKTAHPSLSILINNAGVMRRENLTGARDLHDTVQTITANLLGPIRLTNAVIVNVSSGLGFVPLSGTPTYDATKAAIHSYTVSLREQLKNGRGHRACAARGSDRTHARPIDSRRLVEMLGTH